MSENTSKSPAKAAAASKARPSEDIMAKLREFIRNKGADYLKDPNITSIGIGRKEVDADSPHKHMEGELCVQFTVGKKVANVAEMAELESNPIPERLQVNGMTIPTDVIERVYKPAFHVLAEPVADLQRKGRRDPVQPGMSVGHPTITAGTLGAIVYDAQDGAACMLSNWHVLHGHDGRIGDAVLQPGRHDDMNVAQNAAGTLVRSHLGRAGDCAIARIEGRGFDDTIIGLQGTKITRIGEPELDDIVVKSGRTTDVTYGKVRRVDTIAKIDYGRGVVETIGCFEIGPDAAHPPGNGEVSMGGDSGAAWLAVEPAGKLTDVMVGLHFAGEGSTNPDEHALACYPKSVFTKLDITLARPAAPPRAVVTEGPAGPAYNPAFLSRAVQLPRLLNGAVNDAFMLNSSPHLGYTHFTVCLSKSRRMPRFVAWNIDGENLKRYGRKGLSFRYDDRVSKYLQIGNDAYKDNKLDRGHVARRADLVWGPAAEAKAANRDSFYFTNITPQHQRFNQSERYGLWGLLENAIYEDVDMEALRVTVIGGPVLKDDDMPYRAIKVPDEHWKVLAYVENGALKAKAYILSQADYLDDIEALELDEFRLWQVTVGSLGAMIDLDFRELTQADTLAAESVHHPEMLSPRGRVAREIVRREELFQY